MKPETDLNRGCFPHLFSVAFTRSTAVFHGSPTTDVLACILEAGGKVTEEDWLAGELMDAVVLVSGESGFEISLMDTLMISVKEWFRRICHN